MMRVYIFAAIACLALSSCGSEEETKKGNPYSTAAQEETKGGQLFNSYCVQCHALDEDRIGPALRGAFTHWDNDTARISAFIRNSKQAIESGDVRAVEIADKYNRALMTPMPHLSDDDINALLEYIAE